MTEGTLHIDSPETERRLRRAEKHVLGMWYPVNPKLLEKIRNSFVDGTYALSLDFLIEDLRADSALFTWSLREISKLARDAGISEPFSSIHELFEWAGRDRLKQMLSEEVGRISRHEFSAMNEFQGARIRETVVGVTAAEVIAQAELVDPLEGFSAAQLRQLGLNLIAWNYPTVFKRAFEGESHEGSLDDRISEALGFSPTMLAVSIAADWLVSPEVLSTLDPEGELLACPEEKEEFRKKVQALSRICDIGESLARACDPVHYPEAAEEWREVKDELRTHDLEEILASIRKHAEENIRFYADALPKLFERLKISDPEVELKIYDTNRKSADNQFIGYCDARLQSLIAELYDQMHSKTPLKDQIGFFTRNIVPAAGFSGGCIYSIDPVSLILHPRLVFGDTIETHSPNSVRDHIGSDSAAVDAFHCSTPVVDSLRLDGRTVFAVVIGNQKKIGVLYLEVPSGVLREGREGLLRKSNALKKVISDVLGA